MSGGERVRVGEGGACVTLIDQDQAEDRDRILRELDELYDFDLPSRPSTTHS